MRPDFPMILRFLRSRALWAAVILAAMAWVFFQGVEIHVPKRPTGSLADISALADRDDLNVLFIVVDTLRADHLSAYGYERETSPILDRLADTGVRFANVTAQSTWTKTSMASLWTSTYPTTNRITRQFDALPPEVRMPAEILGEAGFFSAGIYRNGWLDKTFGFDQGFEVYSNPAPVRTAARMRQVDPSEGGEPRSTDWDVTSSASEFLELYGSERFFLYLHYMDAHQYVYESRSSLFGQQFKDSYDNAIHWTDRNVAEVLAKLEGLDIMDRTLVVIASDHGEAFGEHRTEGHARNLYREVVATPLIILLPFFLETGVVVEAPVENIDIWPTIFELVGLPIPAGSQGQSLVPLMMGEKGDPERFQRAYLDRNWGHDAPPRPMVSIAQGDHRLITWEDGTRLELFDHGADPREQVNLAVDESERTAELLEEANVLLEGSPPPWNAEPTQVEIDDVKLGILKALGYVVDDKGERERAPEPEPAPH